MTSFRPTDAAILDDPHKPPVAIAIIQKDHGVSLCSIGLPFDRGDKRMQRVHKLKVNILCALLVQPS